MADEKFGDLSKVNVYGAGDDKLQALQKTQEDAIKALERRFEQPNWLNVSAAFAKPQLGGFGASWGSAMGEMGKTEEQRRESQLPIAEMRAKLAQTNLLLGSKQAIKFLSFFANSTLLILYYFKRMLKCLSLSSL